MTDDKSMRDGLIARATEMRLFDNPEECTDEQIFWAIQAERAAGAWLARMEALPTDEAKSDAVRRLAADFARGSNP